MPIVLAFAVCSHNLVSRDRKIDMQCVYYTMPDYCFRCRRICRYGFAIAHDLHKITSGSLNFIRLLRVVITPSERERRKRLEAIGWISGYTSGCCGRVHRSVLLWCSLKNFQRRLAALFPSLPLPAQLALLVDFLCSVLFAPFPYHGAWSHVITRGMRIQNLRHENISLAEQRIRQDFKFILSTTLLSSRRLSKDKS